MVTVRYCSNRLPVIGAFVLLLLCLLLCSCTHPGPPAVPPDVAQERERPLLGVQRWDMYSGKGYTYEQELGYLPGKEGFLKPAKWHDRAPFFCRLTKDVDWVEHPPNAGPLWFNYPFNQELLQKTMDQVPTYAKATESLGKTYEREFLNRGLPFIPPCTSMQYPWPRALDKETGKPKDNWYHYQWPEEGDLASRVKQAFNFVAAHPRDCEAQTVIMYSWNEFSEGGGLCPTMGKPPDYTPVTTWLDEVAGALREWTYP